MALKSWDIGLGESVKKERPSPISWGQTNEKLKKSRKR